MRKMKVILKIGLIKVSKVTQNLTLLSFFRNMDDIGQPLRILNH